MSPALGVRTGSELRLLSQLGGQDGGARSLVRVDQFVCAIGAVELPVSMGTLSCSNDVTSPYLH